MERTVAMAGVFSAIVPGLCGVIFAVIANLPVTFSAGFLPPPLLALMPLYFWGLVRPDLMPPALAFGIGLLQDILSGSPPGLWAASFVAVYYVIDRERDTFAGLSGAAAILGFALSAFVATATAYLIVSALNARWLAVPPVTGALAITVLFYIPGVMLLGLIHRHLVGPQRMHP